MAHTATGNLALEIPSDLSKLTVPYSCLFGGIASRLLFTETTTIAALTNATAPNNHERLSFMLKLIITCHYGMLFYNGLSLIKGL